MEDGAGALFYCQLVTKTQVKQLKLFFYPLQCQVRISEKQHLVQMKKVQYNENHLLEH